MSDQNSTPPGEGYPPPGSQPPPGGPFPPPAPTSGGAYPPPGSGAGFPPPPSSGGGFPPPTSGGPVPPSGGPYPPQGASFPPPGGYDPNAQQPGFQPQPGYDPNAQPGFQPGHDPNAQPGFQPGYDPNAQPGFQQPGFQPGYDPNAQQPFGTAPGAPLPPMTPPGRGNKVKIAVAVVGALLLLCCIGAAVAIPRFLSGDALADAKQGDCLKGEVADGTSDKFKAADLELVDCGDSAATYVVAGKVTGKTQSEAENDNNVCAAYKDADTVFWIGPDGKKGTVLCLKAQ